MNDTSYTKHIVLYVLHKPNFHVSKWGHTITSITCIEDVVIMGVAMKSFIAIMRDVCLQPEPNQRKNGGEL